MFVHFISRQGRNLLVNIKDISFVLQKGVFCEIHIRGIEGHVVVEDDFSEVYRKIKEIPPRVNNTDEGVSGGVDVRQDAVIDILLIIVFSLSLLICGKVSADTGWQSGGGFQGAVEFGSTITLYDDRLSTTVGIPVVVIITVITGIFAERVRKLSPSAVSYDLL